MQITLTAGEVTRLQDSIKENENGIGADLDSFKQRVWTFLRTNQSLSHTTSRSNTPCPKKPRSP